MRFGYGYRRDVEAFWGARVDRVVIDADPQRPARLKMLKGDLCDGDTIVLLAWSDLAGTPRASDQMANRIRGMGISIETSSASAATVGQVSGGGHGSLPVRRRSPQLAPTPEQDTEIEQIWHDGLDTQMNKLRRVADVLGRGLADMTRHQLNYRYGTPESPKHPSRRVKPDATSSAKERRAEQVTR